MRCNFCSQKYQINGFLLGVLLFDNAPSHTKTPSDALNVNSMNVFPGGTQAVMRDTVWAGEVQKMVFDDGTPKGMKQVLEERGVDTAGMLGADMRETLREFDDFNSQKTLVEELVEGRGHIAYFIPKYHCELNPIERVWCHSKKYISAHNNGTITRLRKILPTALDTVDKDLISKFFITCRDYEHAYKQHHVSNIPSYLVEQTVKEYKSH